MQELRLRATCSKPHHFHPSLVTPQLHTAGGHCSIISIQAPKATAPQPPITVGLSALLTPLVVAAPPKPHDAGCQASAAACRCLCAAATLVQLSPAVRVWNAVLPFAQLELRASAACCAGTVQLLPWSAPADAAPGAPGRVPGGAQLMLSPSSCGASVRLASAAPAGVFSLLYMGLPPLLLSAAIALVHGPTADCAARPLHAYALSDTAQQLLSTLALTACVPDTPLAGRLVVVLAGRGLAIGMAAAAASIAGSASRMATAAMGICPHRLRIQLPRLVAGIRGRWPFAAVAAAAGFHVFLSIQLSLACLFGALVCCISRRHAADARQIRSISGAADRTEACSAGGRADGPSGKPKSGTGGRLASTVRARSAVNTQTQRAETECMEGLSAEGQGSRCRCVEARGPAVVAAVALAGGLALPGFIASARAAWLAPAVEDAAPGAVIAFGALLVAAEWYGAVDAAPGSSRRPAPSMGSSCCQFKASTKVILPVHCCLPVILSTCVLNKDGALRLECT